APISIFLRRRRSARALCRCGRRPNGIKLIATADVDRNSLAPKVRPQLRAKDVLVRREEIEVVSRTGNAVARNGNTTDERISDTGRIENSDDALQEHHFGSSSIQRE